jgi:hypothetical protein
MKLRALLAVLGTVAAVLVPAFAAVPAQAACTNFFTVTDSNGVTQQADADNFGGGTLCINNSDGASDFTVDPGDGTGTSVQSYPNLSYGCGFPPSTNCTSGTNLPVHLTQVTSLHATFATNHSGVSGTNKYDTALDLFFQPSASNPDPSAEVLVMANAARLPVPPGATMVTIGGVSWNRWVNPRSAVISGTTVNWDEIVYRRVNPTSTFSNIDLGPILVDAIYNSGGGLDFTQYLRYFACGFEVWTNGGQLALDNCLMTLVVSS